MAARSPPVAPESQLLLSEVSCGGGAGPRPLRAVLRVPAEHPVFAGHFPGAPLVPGVLLVEAVRIACERTLARSLRLAAVDDVRFTRPVAPDEAVSLQALVTCTDAGVAVDGEWHGGAGRIATFRLRLAKGHA